MTYNFVSKSLRTCDYITYLCTSNLAGTDYDLSEDGTMVPKHVGHYNMEQNNKLCICWIIVQN